jgi:general secretion pathway protein G
LKRRFTIPRALRGLTLVELMIVMAIIAVVCTMGFVRYRRTIQQAEEVVAVKQLKDIVAAIAAYEQQHGQLPPTLDDLGLGPLIDPWGNPYQYLVFDDGGGNGGGGGNGHKRKDRFLVPINSRFDLYSMGADGKSVAPLTAAQSQDDVIVANDGDFIGLASLY